jgi:hypothetical protein
MEHFRPRALPQSEWKSSESQTVGDKHGTLPVPTRGFAAMFEEAVFEEEGGDGVFLPRRI